MKRIYAANTEQWDKCCKKSWRKDKILSIEKVDQGIILPAKKGEGEQVFHGGVCTNDFTFVAGFLRTSKEPSDKMANWNGLSSSYTVQTKELQTINEEVIYGGVLLTHFGHFILECMSRFWYILLHPEDKRRIVFLTIWGQRTWFYDFFDLLGIERERILFLERPTQFFQVIVPEESVHAWCCFYDGYRIPHKYLMCASNNNNVNIRQKDKKTKFT